MDVKNVFLNEELNIEVYIKHPQGFENKLYLQHVCKLKKVLYGLNNFQGLGIEKLFSSLSIVIIQLYKQILVYLSRIEKGS